jgi:predicted RecB family nuclease
LYGPKKELTLVDWKLANSIDDTYAVQTAAYKKMFEKMTGLKIKRVRVMKIDKFSDKFKCYNVPGLPAALKAFQNISKVYDWMYDGKKKLIEDKIIVTI